MASFNPESGGKEEPSRDLAGYEESDGLLPEYKQNHSAPSRISRESWFSLKLLGMTVALSLVLTLVILGPTIHWTSPHRRLKDCSGLSQEERAIICRFDIMSFSWLPPACFDGALVDEFNSVQEWRYWEHKRGLGGEVTREEAQKGLRDFYVSWEHHRHHCIFMWKKLHRAVVSNRPIDSYVGNYGHTKHCDRMLFSDETSNISVALINSPIEIKTPTCGIEYWNWPGQIDDDIA